MSIRFELIENELILIYTTDYSIKSMLERLEDYDYLIIKRTFNVNKDDRRFSNNKEKNVT